MTVNILSPFQILEGKHWVFHHLYINYSFFTDILYSIQFEKFSFFSLVKILTIDSCQILSTFSTYIKMTICFLLYSSNVPNYIDCFTNIKPIYIPEMNFIWPLYTTFFHIFELLIMVDNFFLYLQMIFLYIFLIMSLSSFDTRIVLATLNALRNSTSSSILWNDLRLVVFHH